MSRRRTLTYGSAVVGAALLMIGLGLGTVVVAASVMRDMTATYFWLGDMPWSPDGSQIVYGLGDRRGILQTELYTLDIESGAVRRISPDAAPDTLQEPTWSPDGQTIAFTGYPNGLGAPDELYTLSIGSNDNASNDNTSNNNGDDLHQLTQDGIYYKTSLAWSPDGTQMAYFTSDFAGYNALHLVDLDGNNTILREDIRYPYEFPVAWSSDGTLLIVPLIDSTHIIDTQTGESIAELPVWTKQFAWSPDSVQNGFGVVFYASDLYREDFEPRGLYTFDLQSGAFNHQGITLGDIIDVEWTEAGFGFMRYGSSRSSRDRRVLRQMGEARTLLSEAGHQFNQYVRWSPDETRILFGGRYALHILDADNGEILLSHDPHQPGETRTSLLSGLLVIIGAVLLLPLGWRRIAGA